MVVVIVDNQKTSQYYVRARHFHAEGRRLRSASNRFIVNAFSLIDAYCAVFLFVFISIVPTFTLTTFKRNHEL